MDDSQKIQEDLYEFPYHHIPSLKNGNFSAIRSYRGAHQYYAKLNFLISKIKQINPKNILDVGCGDGKFLHELSEHFSDISLTGIDYSQKAISFASSFSPSVSFVCGDITKNQITQKNFELITLIEVLEHIPPKQIENFIHGIHNCISSDGILFVTVPTKNTPTSKKHYQHFNLKNLENSLKPYFIIKETFYVNKITFFTKIIKSLLANRFFALNHKSSLNKLFQLYLKKSFHGDADNSESVFIICMPNTP